MRELDKTPANPTIMVDSRFYPKVAGFSRQARTAVVLPNFVDRTQLAAAGNDRSVQAREQTEALAAEQAREGVVGFGEVDGLGRFGGNRCRWG